MSRKQMRKAGILSGILAGIFGVVAPGGAIHAACNYQSPVGSCRLTADLNANGLTVLTDTNACAAVEYRLDGAVRRMYLDTGRGIEPNVRSASTGVDVLSCKTYAQTNAPSNLIPGTQPLFTGTQPVRTSERILNTNLVATGQRMVNVQVPVYEKRVYVERQIPVEKKVYVEKPVYIENRVPVEKKVYIEKPVYIDRQVPVERKVYINRNIPVEKPVYVPYYIKPQVDVRYNQLIPGLPAGMQVPGLPQPTVGFNPQQPFVQPRPQFQQPVQQSGFQPAGTLISNVPLR